MLLFFFCGIVDSAAVLAVIVVSQVSLSCFSFDFVFKANTSPHRQPAEAASSAHKEHFFFLIYTLLCLCVCVCVIVLVVFTVFRNTLKKQKTRMCSHSFF